MEEYAHYQNETSAGTLKWSDRPLTHLLYDCSSEQIRYILDNFKESTNGTDSIENLIQRGTKGEVHDFYLKILRYVEDRVNHNALFLQTALARENHYKPNTGQIISRVFVLRSEIDLFDIVEKYNNINNHTLQKAIKDAYFSTAFTNVLLDFINPKRNKHFS